VGLRKFCELVIHLVSGIITSPSKLDFAGHLQGNVLVTFLGTQLQREEHARNALSGLSRQIEIVALDLVKGGWKHVYRLQ
jgi:hypothetical protein